MYVLLEHLSQNWILLFVTRMLVQYFALSFFIKQPLVLQLHHQTFYREQINVLLIFIDGLLRLTSVQT